MLEVAAQTTPTSRVTTSGGWALVVAGVTGAFAAVFLAFVPPAVPADQFGYPLGHAAFTAIQVFFFVHHLPLAYGLLAVWRSGLAGAGKLAAIGGLSSALSMTLLAVQELVAITATGAAYPSEQTRVVESIYGIISLLNGATLIVFGIAALRAHRWKGWRRMILLALGIFVIVPLTPAMFGPFVLARLTIGLWMLLFAALGWALLRPDSVPAQVAAPSGP